MASIDVDNSNLEDLVKRDVVFFYAWSKRDSASAGFVSAYDSVAAKHPGIAFAKVDVMAQAEAAHALELTTFPALFVLREEIVVHLEEGPLSRKKLETIVTDVMSLDMGEVHDIVDDDDD